MRILSIDVGGHYFKIGIVEERRILKFLKKKTDRKNVLRDLERIIKNNRKNIDGVAVGFPGLVKDGIVFYPPNFPDIIELDVKGILSKDLKIETIVENDANLYAIGEAIEGAGKDFKNVIVMTLGTGVGGGIIIDGKIYKGKDGFAGEIGHIVIEKDGELCGCGMRGCLESYVGAERILRDFNVLKRKRGGKEAKDVKEIGELGREGDEDAIFVINEAGRNIGVAISSLVNILAPDVFIIGGGISNLWDIMEKPVKDEVRRRIKRDVEIRKGVLGDNAGIIGGYIIFEQYGRNKTP